MTMQQLLDAVCPHGNIMHKCHELWCMARVEDLLSDSYESKLPEIPDRNHDA